MIDPEPDSNTTDELRGLFLSELTRRPLTGTSGLFEATNKPETTEPDDRVSALGLAVLEQFRRKTEGKKSE